MPPPVRCPPGRAGAGQPPWHHAGRLPPGDHQGFATTPGRSPKQSSRMASKQVAADRTDALEPRRQDVPGRRCLLPSRLSARCVCMATATVSRRVTTDPGHGRARAAFRSDVNLMPIKTSPSRFAGSVLTSLRERRAPSAARRPGGVALSALAASMTESTVTGSAWRR